MLSQVLHTHSFLTNCHLQRCLVAFVTTFETIVNPDITQSLSNDDGVVATSCNAVKLYQARTIRSIPGWFNEISPHSDGYARSFPPSNRRAMTESSSPTLSAARKGGTLSILVITLWPLRCIATTYPLVMCLAR